MIKLFLPLFLILLSAQGFAKLSTLEKKLFELPDVIFSPIAVPEGFKASFELAVWFFLNGEHHGSARIKNMTPSQRLLFLNTLEN